MAMAPRRRHGSREMPNQDTQTELLQGCLTMRFRPQNEDLTPIVKAKLHENPVVWLLERSALPFSSLLGRVGISANLVTALSFLFALSASVVLIGFESPIGFALAWAISVYLDFTDGQLARRRQKTHRSAFRADHTSDLVKFVLVSLSLGYFWDRTSTWVIVFLGVSVIMLYTVLNHDLGFRQQTAASLSEPLISRGRTRPWIRAVWVPVVTFHGGSVLLICIAPLSALATVLVYAYFLLIGCTLVTRNTVLLLRLPR